MAMIVQLIALISLWLQAGRALHVFQPYKTVGRGGEAVIRCFYDMSSQAEELRVTLYRGIHEMQEVCTSTFNSSQSYFQTQKCQGKVWPDGVDVTMSGLKGANTDFYLCALEVLYPPPYISQVGNGTLVHIQEEPDCPASAEKVIADPEDTSKEAYALPIILFAFIVIIIIIIIIAVINNILNTKHRREIVVMPPIASKKVDGRYSYENFL